ncbi:FAD-binding oxidoreductase [Jatrophihabitans fulvus]
MSTFAPALQPVGEADVAALATGVTGRVLVPGDEGYAEVALPFNVAAASTPVALVEATGAADVAITMRFARDHGVEVAVQATGHGATPLTRPTLLVHTGRMNSVTIDPEARTARVGAGVRWQQVLDAAAVHGLAPLAGSSPLVGVVGYTTGGGVSPVGRTFGFAADHVRSLDVVTGDGEIRHASPLENPDLFWALRGGKGAAGIVTAMEFDLFPVASIHGGSLHFAAEHVPAVVRAWRAWCRDLPEQASTSIAVMRMPDLPFVPAPLAGRTTVAVRFAYVGDAAEGERVLAPMRRIAPVVFGEIGELPFAALAAVHKDPVDPMPVHERGRLLRDLDDAAIDVFLDRVGPHATTPLAMVELRLLGGAFARSPRHANAVSHRDAAFSLLAIGVLAPPIAEATVADADALTAAMQPWSVGGLANFGGVTEAGRPELTWDPATLERLRAIAAVHDPAGVLSVAKQLG